MPGPVGTDEAIEKLVFAHTLDQGVTCGLVVATLDVEATEERLEDERGDDGYPGFQKVHTGCVGAELFEDVDRQLALEVPGFLWVAVGKNDRAPTAVHLAVVGGAPLWQGRPCPRWFPRCSRAPP